MFAELRLSKQCKELSGGLTLRIVSPIEYRCRPTSLQKHISKCTCILGDQFFLVIISWLYDFV